jgi:hypothetical protein
LAAACSAGQLATSHGGRRRDDGRSRSRRYRDRRPFRARRAGRVRRSRRFGCSGWRQRRSNRRLWRARTGRGRLAVQRLQYHARAGALAEAERRDAVVAPKGGIERHQLDQVARLLRDAAQVAHAERAVHNQRQVAGGQVDRLPRWRRSVRAQAVAVGPCLAAASNKTGAGEGSETRRRRRRIRQLALGVEQRGFSRTQRNLAVAFMARRLRIGQRGAHRRKADHQHGQHQHHGRHQRRPALPGETLHVPP